MARLYADENFDYPVVEYLRQFGHDVLTVQEAGQGGQKIPDAAVLAFAVSQGRAVLTFDRRDYRRLHRRVFPHSGIIVCKRDDFAALAARIHQAIISCPNLDNQLLVVNRPPIP
jgi:predicted nuclease of predicted toxin-antitoxin system